MSNALHDYAKLFERYAANNGGTGAILAGEDCLSLANEMRMDADAIDAENAKLRELVAKYSKAAKYLCGHAHCNECNLDCATVFDSVPNGWDCARMLLDKEARELGVEVDG